MSELVLYHGDCIEVLQRLDPESVDAVVTDPPYGLEFMGAKWDSFRVDDAAGHGRHRGENAGTHGGVDRSGPSVAFQGSVPGTAYGGGKRARTQRCVSCGKRDQFRGRHYPCGDGTWRAELIDPFAAPPTMLAFQEWCRRWAIEVYRVLRPGGYMLAFGGTRTYHRMVAGVEDAGFEIRDTVAWLYGQGFPKSLNVGSAIDAHVTGEPIATAPATPEGDPWRGAGTALKPAHEPIVVARKPLQGSVAANVLEHGTGALQIDAARLPVAEGDPVLEGVWTSRPSAIRPGTQGFVTSTEEGDRRSTAPPEGGRWPANVALGHSAECKPIGVRSVPSTGRHPAQRSGLGYGSTSDGTDGDAIEMGGEDGLETVEAWECAPGCAVAMLDAQSGELTSGPNPRRRGPDGARVAYAGFGGQPEARAPRGIDRGGASRFFYVAKASTGERNRGLGHLQAEPAQKWNEGGIKARRELTAKPAANIHPTVKPLDLMHWLVRLVAPPGGVVLDPFAGSGTTGVACRIEHLRCVLIEEDATYLPIIAGRLGVQETPVGEMRLERTRVPEPETPRRVLGNARFACPHCDRAFTDRSLYVRHWRSSHDPRRPPTEEPEHAAR